MFKYKILTIQKYEENPYYRKLWEENRSRPLFAKAKQLPPRLIFTKEYLNLKNGDYSLNEPGEILSFQDSDNDNEVRLLIKIHPISYRDQ